MWLAPGCLKSLYLLREIIWDMGEQWEARQWQGGQLQDRQWQGEREWHDGQWQTGQ